MLVVRNKKNDLPLFSDFVNDFFGGYGVNEFFNNSFVSNSKNVNIEETESSYELSMELPGFTKDDIKVEVENDVLTISSEVEKKEEVNEKKFIKKSFSKSSFKKSYILTEDVDKENINAKLENGILNLSIGKIRQIEEKTKTKLIDIM